MFFLTIIVILTALYLYQTTNSKFKKSAKPKICTNEDCKKLTDMLILLMKKKLKFENWRESKEIQDVKIHLKQMQSEVHCVHVHNIEEDNFKKIGEEIICMNEICRLQIYQCLRTSLVEHPDDLRGRRRANLARQILENDIYYERDYVYNMEMFFECCYDTILCRNPKAKEICNTIFGVFSHLWKTIVFVLDAVSDIQVIWAVWIAQTLVKGLKALKCEVAIDGRAKSSDLLSLTDFLTVG